MSERERAREGGRECESEGVGTGKEREARDGALERARVFDREFGGESLGRERQRERARESEKEL